MDQEIEKIILSFVKNKTLTCEDAHTISATYKIALAQIGEIADKLQIKIVQCKLGCF